MALYYRHPLSLEHDTGSHPENANRIRAIEAELAGEGWLGLEVVEAPPAEVAQMERVHTPEHVAAMRAICERGGGMVDGDTIASPRSYEAAIHGAGAAADGARRLVAGEVDFVFCGLRPPGHHAERDRAMGFCLFDSIAVGAEEARASGAERVMIVDWDVHHGNGTQDIFYESSPVLFTSIHQSPLYPGTGQPGETGAGEGAGRTVNLPVPPGAGPDEFLALIQTVVVPLAESFEPQLIAVSAGYDAHRDDPLAQCTLDEGAYADMAASLRIAAGELGAGILVCLEGGYDTGALSRSVAASIRGFTDESLVPRAAPPEAAAAHRERLAGSGLL